MLRWLALHLTAAAITVTANRGSSLIVGYFHIRTISTSLGFVVFAIVSVTQVQVIRSRISNPGLGLSRSVPLAAFGLACVLSATRFILIEVGMAKRITTPWTVATVIDLVLALVLFFEAVMLLFFCVRTKKAVDLTVRKENSPRMKGLRHG
jgi:hypothetical protein